MNIEKYISDSIITKQKILQNPETISTIKKIAEEIVNTLRENNKVLTAGNGGSASDAQHIAGELVSKFLKERSGLTAFALTTNTSILTAISNDYGYKKVFARQIQAVSKKGDIFIALSTSGYSENIILALEEARNRGVITVGLTGQKQCKMDKFCDYIIHVPSESTPIIQESHTMIGHILCALAEETLFG